MATVSDTFNRSDTSQGTLGSTDTGNLAWQNATQWNISTNAANNTQASDVAWAVIPNPNAEVGIQTGVSATPGNGVGAAFWVEDASNYWISYVYGERYQSGTVCNPGNYTCTDCGACGGGNVNPVTYVSSESKYYYAGVVCPCVATKHGACSCDGSGTASRVGGNVIEVEDICDGPQCARLTGNNAQTCVTFNFTNPETGGNYASGGNENATNYNPSNYTATKGGNYASGGNQNASTGGNYASGGNCNKTTKGSCTGSYNAVKYNPVVPGTYNKTNYNAIVPGGNYVSGGNYASGGNTNPTNYNPIGGGNPATSYSCTGGNYVTGLCDAGCTAVSNPSSYCSGANCPGVEKTCVSGNCGTMGTQYYRTCDCTATGGNTNACNTCGSCYDACLTTSPVYSYRYYLKTDRIASGTATNAYTSSTLYDSSSGTQSWGSIKVVTDEGSYTATVYTDAAWTTSAATSGSQASGQNDYLSSIGHGMGVRPMGSQNPGETNQIDFWYTNYVASGDSVGVLVA